METLFGVTLILCILGFFIGMATESPEFLLFFWGFALLLWIWKFVLVIVVLGAILGGPIALYLKREDIKIWKLERKIAKEKHRQKFNKQIEKLQNEYEKLLTLPYDEAVENDLINFDKQLKCIAKKLKR